jgi:methylmalonyl-CoA epimerase
VSIEIDHLGIAVRTLDESLKFYGDIVGLPVSGREYVAAENVNVAMLPCGIAPGSPRIELLEGTAAESAITRFLDKRGPGLHHIALRVDDLPAAVARLKAAGARVLNEPRAGAGGHEYVFVHPESTGGVLLELIQSRTEG